MASDPLKEHLERAFIIDMLSVMNTENTRRNHEAVFFVQC